MHRGITFSGVFHNAVLKQEGEVFALPFLLFAEPSTGSQWRFCLSKAFQFIFQDGKLLDKCGDFSLLLADDDAER